MNLFIVLSALGLSHRTSTASGWLRILQNGIEKMGTRAPANARDTLDSLAEAVASALWSWADRFRQCQTLGVLRVEAKRGRAKQRDATNFRATS
jgi:hypothetical protein